MAVTLTRLGSLRGFVESINVTTVVGWALNEDQNGTPLNIGYRSGGPVFYQVTTNEDRPDVAEFFPANPRCGFRFELPISAVMDARSSTIEICAENEADCVSLEFLPAARDGLKKLRKSILNRALKGAYTCFDILDLFTYMRHHSQVSGIQRVVSGLIKELATVSDPRSEVLFTTLRADGSVHVLERTAVASIVATILTGDYSSEQLSVALDSVYAASQIYVPSSGDHYFIVGAFWVLPNIGTVFYDYRLRGVTTGAMVYDLIPVLHSHWVTRATFVASQTTIAQVIEDTDHFITISEYVKTELDFVIANEFGKQKNVVAVTLPHEIPNTPGDFQALEIQLPERQYVLCVGTLEGRKNHILLYRVWASLIRIHGRDKVPTLVLVGRWGWNNQRFSVLCQSSNFLQGKIRHLENVNDRELSQLYANCLFTIFPSFMEGWGLPIGEALANGKFCIASKTSSMPEVGGDFVEYIDPHNIFEAIEVVGKYLFDEDLLARRSERIKTEFVGKTWAEYSAEIFATVVDGKKAAQAMHTGASAYQLEVSKNYPCNSRRIQDDITASWPSKGLRKVTRRGWGSFETWGVWAIEASAALQFRVDADLAQVEVHLELIMPRRPNAQIIRISDASGNTASFSVTSWSTWVSLVVYPNSNGIVELEISAPRLSCVPNGNNRIYFGLISLTLHHVTTTNLAIPRS